MEFPFDNPVVMIAMLYGIISFFMSKKKAAQKKAAVANQARTSVREGSSSTAQVSAKTPGGYRNKIEEALRNAMEQADREFSGSAKTTPVVRIEQPARSASASSESQPAASSDPFAFHSLMGGGEKTRVDYDQTATDYDARKAAFGFRPAVNESTDQEFHLASFKGFQAAHALTAAERRRIDAEAPVVEEDAGPMISVGNADEIRRAIIMQEVLGKPKSVRRR